MPATLTVTADPTNVPPRNILTVGIPAGNTGISVLLTRSDPDGVTRPVRLADPATIAGTSWIGYDYEAPYGVSTSYTAVVQYGDPAVINTTYNLHSNPSFETSITGWSGSSFFGSPTPTSIAQSSAQAFSGTKSLLVTWGASATSYAWSSVGGLTVGATYNVSCYVFVPAGAPQVKFEYIGFTATAANATNGAWERLSMTITANSSSIPLGLRNQTGGAGALAYLDAVMVSPGSALNNYGDGNSAGWVWDGTTNLSTSRRPADPAGIVTETVTTAGTLPVADVWLVHPGTPSASVKLSNIQRLEPRLRPVNRGIFQPYGRKFPIVVTDGRRKAPSSQVQLRTVSLAESVALNALIDDAATLLLNVPAGLGWGVTTEYVSFGDSTEAREIDYGGDPQRVWTLPYQVVDRPVGGSQAQRTWADVLGEVGTWQAAVTKYATWGSLLAGSS